MAKLSFELTTKSIKKAALLIADTDLTDEQIQKIEEQKITMSETELDEAIESQGVMVFAAILVAKFLENDTK